MFGIWKHNPDSRGGGNIRQSFVPANVRVNPQQSCKNCRAKKLKTGCSRCKTLNSIIRYAKPGDNGKYRRKPQVSKKPMGDQDQDWILNGINEDVGPESYECPPRTPAVENWTMPMGMEFEDHQDKTIQEPLPQYNTPDHTPRTTRSTDPDLESSCKSPPFQVSNPLSTVLPDDIDISSWIRSPVSLGDPGPGLTALPGTEIEEDTEAAVTSLPTPHTTTPGSSRNPNNNFNQSETSSNAGNAPERNLSVCGTSNAPSLQCRCLARVVLLLDELESPSDSPESISSLHSLDSILASIKETLSHAGAMLLCSLCTSKMENMTILAFLFSHLASTCQIIAEKYPHDSDLTALHRSSSAYGRYDWPPLPRVDPGAQESSEDYFHAYGFGGNRDNDIRETLVGEYEVDSPQEWRALMRALASLQLQQLHSMMQAMKIVPIVANCKSLLRRLTAAEGKLTGVKLRIQKRSAEL
ncbi:hypothetical protein F4781DRAFT_409950 [Annulohypoxylon bovei var. microspora]|nr:hypothetical protein F4781DRAFT_409950 [Annulohypoxylon bovei var. microspora]